MSTDRPAALPDRPGADDFRALARSSPWLFRTMHLQHRSDVFGDRIEAWLDRPAHRVIVRSPTGLEVSTDVPYGVSGDEAQLRRAIGAPRFRTDGLVADRPYDWHLAYGDPMWTNYTWTAMLDPVELAGGVGVGQVGAQNRLGRLTWEAVCTPLMDTGEDGDDGYDPRCGCCPLLDSLPSRVVEYGADDPQAQDPDLPTTYRVQLDAGTGIVVEIEALDGRPGLVLRNEIRAVDEPLSPA